MQPFVIARVAKQCGVRQAGLLRYACNDADAN